MSKADGPAIGMLLWTCHCGATARVGGDVGDDTGWAQVAEHRKQHREEDKRRRKEAASG